jgi:hypothetical protein
MTAFFIFITFGLPLLVFMAPPFGRPLKWPRLRFWLSVSVVWCGLYCLQKYVISPLDLTQKWQLERLKKTGIELGPSMFLGWIPGLFGAAVGLGFGYWLRKPDPDPDPDSGTSSAP